MLRELNNTAKGVAKKSMTRKGGIFVLPYAKIGDMGIWIMKKMKNMIDDDGVEWGDDEYLKNSLLEQPEHEVEPLEERKSY